MKRSAAGAGRRRLEPVERFRSRGPRSSRPASGRRDAARRRSARCRCRRCPGRSRTSARCRRHRRAALSSRFAPPSTKAATSPPLRRNWIGVLPWCSSRFLAEQAAGANGRQGFRGATRRWRSHRRPAQCLRRDRERGARCRRHRACGLRARARPLWRARRRRHRAVGDPRAAHAAAAERQMGGDRQHRHAFRFHARDLRKAERVARGPSERDARHKCARARGRRRNSSSGNSRAVAALHATSWHRAPAAPRRNRHTGLARTDCRRRSPCCAPPARRSRAPRDAERQARARQNRAMVTPAPSVTRGRRRRICVSARSVARTIGRDRGSPSLTARMTSVPPPRNRAPRSDESARRRLAERAKCLYGDGHAMFLRAHAAPADAADRVEAGLIDLLADHCASSRPRRPAAW